MTEVSKGRREGGLGGTDDEAASFGVRHVGDVGEPIRLSDEHTGCRIQRGGCRDAVGFILGGGQLVAL